MHIVKQYFNNLKTGSAESNRKAFKNVPDKYKETVCILCGINKKNKCSCVCGTSISVVERIL